VRLRQTDAYEILDNLVQEMGALLIELRAWQVEPPLGGFSPADPRTMRVPWLLKNLKDMAADHLYTEVVGIIKTYDEHVADVLANVKILISTTDAANKLFSKLLVGPAKALHNTCQIDLAILDEAQRFEMLPAAAIFSTVPTALVMADPNQRIVPDKTYSARNPWSRDGLWGTLKNPEPS